MAMGTRERGGSRSAGDRLASRVSWSGVGAPGTPARGRRMVDRTSARPNAVARVSQPGGWIPALSLECPGSCVVTKRMHERSASRCSSPAGGSPVSVSPGTPSSRPRAERAQNDVVLPRESLHAASKRPVPVVLAKCVHFRMIDRNAARRWFIREIGASWEGPCAEDNEPAV